MFKLIKILMKSLIKKNSGNCLLLLCMSLIFLVPTFLYNTTSSVIYAVKNQRETVYGNFSDIYYRDTVYNISSISDGEFKMLLPDYKYESYGVFYTVKKIELEGNKFLNIGYADSEAIRLGNVTLSEGNFAKDDDEIALTRSIVEILNLSIGDNVAIGEQNYVLCGIINDFGRLWIRGELQIKNNISTINAFVTEKSANQIFDENVGINQQIVIKSENGIFNINNDPERLFTNIVNSNAINSYTVPQSFMILMYIISMLIVITILILNRSKLLVRLKNYYLLGIEKKELNFLILFEMIFITFWGMIIGILVSAFLTMICVNALIAKEYNVLFKFNSTDNLILIISLFAGLLIIFFTYASWITDMISLDYSENVKQYKFNDNKKISFFKFDSAKNIKVLSFITIIIALSCTMLSYGIAYKNYFTEDVTEIADGYIQRDYDFQFVSKIINAPPLTDPNTGEQITPVFFTDDYEKNGADQNFINKISSLDGVTNVVPYRENTKMNLLIKENQVDEFFDGSDSVIDGRYSMEQFININDYEKIWYNFGYEPDDILVSSEVVGYSEESLEKLKDYVIDGQINIEKLRSGEEIILRVPAYKLEQQDFGGMILTGIIPTNYTEPNSINMISLKVGDEITLSGLLTDKKINGGVSESELSSFYRKDIKVKIGGIIRSIDGKLPSSKIGASCSVLTLNSALDTLEIPAKYSVISIYTDINANNDAIANTLVAEAILYPNMTFENWSSDIRSYKIYNMLVSIFSITLIIILITVAFIILTGQIYIKTKLNISQYALYRINGLSFKSLINSLIKQILITYFIGAMLSIPMTMLLIKKAMSLSNFSTVLYYFPYSLQIYIATFVLLILLISTLPSIILLFKQKDNLIINIT